MSEGEQRIVSGHVWDGEKYVLTQFVVSEEVYLMITDGIEHFSIDPRPESLDPSLCPWCDHSIDIHRGFVGCCQQAGHGALTGVCDCKKKASEILEMRLK